MYNYSMMPIVTDHLDEMCDDIKQQYTQGVTTCPLFIMTLVPEGDPVWDKAGDLCGKYAMYRDKLSSEGVSSGILVQASLGHGYNITPAPFTRFVGVTDGVERNVYCPLDKDCRDLLERIIDRMGLSARACTRIIKLARTIADLAGCADIRPEHLSEAASYRFLDRRNIF